MRASEERNANYLLKITVHFFIAAAHLKSWTNRIILFGS